MRKRISVLRDWLERLLLWRVWERMLEIEFVDRSVALAGKAFVSFFPLVIVVAAFVPERPRVRRSSPPSRPDSAFEGARARLRPRRLRIVRRRSQGDGRCSVSCSTIFFATSFTTAVQRVYFHAWRRPPPWRIRRVLARDLLAPRACSPTWHSSAACARPSARGRARPLRRRVTGGERRTVVVHGLVPPAGRRARRGCCSPPD